MPDDFMENLTVLTDNTGDIRFPRWATITQTHPDNTYDCREDTGTLHKNVKNTTTHTITLNQTVVLSFIDNDIHQPIITGAIQ